jgi:hypothetical protein
LIPSGARPGDGARRQGKYSTLAPARQRDDHHVAGGDVCSQQSGRRAADAAGAANSIPITRGAAKMTHESDPILDLEIHIAARRDAHYPVRIRLGDEQDFHGEVAADALMSRNEGRAIFATLFADPQLRRAWDMACGKSQRRRVRLWLDADAPELHALPWETLHDGQTWLAASAATPFSRYLPSDAPWGGLVTERPIRILSVIANPADLARYDLAPLDMAAERSLLATALGDLVPQHFELEHLAAPATLERLESALAAEPHVLHFVGHGTFSHKRGEAALYLQDAASNTQIVTEAQLVAMLRRQATSPRLIFLAACQSAARSTADAFAGMAPKLVQAGVPAVVAMQDKVAISAVGKLTTAFYEALLRCGEVDRALNAARSLLLTGQSPDAGVPVLLMRLRNGRLWEPSEFSPQLKSQRKYPVPRTADPVPEHFVTRPEISEKLKERLLKDENRHPGILPISVLHGLGGAGKSTLASKLATDDDVYRRFPDGVLWTRLGQQPQILSELIKWIRELGDSGFNTTDVDAASKHLRTLLASRAVLLVVDDAWNPDDVLPFKVGSTHCHLLVTTRRGIVADVLKAHTFEVGPMSPDQALELFSSRLTHSMGECDRQDAMHFAKKVGYLPMAMDLGAVQVSKGMSVSALLNAIEEKITGLEALQDPRYADRRELSLLACINLSLDRLRDENQEAWRSFSWLGLLPEDVDVTASMAATLWDVDEEKSFAILKLLQDESLLLHSLPIRINGKEYQAYRMQDILHEMARSVLTMDSPEGLGMALSEGHLCLLNRYQAQMRDEQWHTLPNDGYIHDHLVHHLEQAGQMDDLLALFSTPEWMRKRYKQAIGYHSYIEDLWRVQKIFEDHNVTSLPERIILSYLEWQIRYVYKEMPENLLKFYLALGGKWGARVIATAQLMPKLSQRVQYLARSGNMLINQGRPNRALQSLNIAVEIYLTSSEADFYDEHVRRNLGDKLAISLARIGEVCYPLLDSIHTQYKWLSELYKEHGEIRDETTLFINDSLTEIIKALGQAGATKEARDLIRRYLSKYPSRKKLRNSREYSRLVTTCIEGLIQEGHYSAAEELSVESQDPESIDDFWEKHLNLLKINSYGSIWIKIQGSPSEKVLENKCKKYGFEDSWKKIPSPKKNYRQFTRLRKWVTVQCQASMWQLDFDAARKYLKWWERLNNGENIPFPEAELSAFNRLLDSDKRYGSPILSYGTWDDLQGSLLWLTILQKFDFLDQLSKSEMRWHWNFAYRGEEIPSLLHLSDVYTIKDLQAWLSSLSTQSQWNNQRETKLIGARYLAFNLAREDQINEAQQVGDLLKFEEIYVSIGQGIALTKGVEKGRAYIREHCSRLMQYDFAADLWAIARVLLMFGKYEEAWKLALTDTFDHPGRDRLWVDLAGQLYVHLSPEEFATRLSHLEEYRTVIDIAGRLIVVDTQYAGKVLDAITVQREDEPTWGKGLRSSWWPEDKSKEACVLLEQYNSRLKTSKISTGNKVNLTIIKRTLGMIDVAENVNRIQDRIISHAGEQYSSVLLFLVCEGTLWIGSNKIDLPLLNSLNEVQEILTFIETSAKLGLEDNLFSNPAALQFLCCVFKAFPYKEFYHSQLQLFTEQLADNLELGKDPLVWLLLPPALASIGQIKQAQVIATKLINLFAYEWKTNASISEVDVLSDEWQRTIEDLHNYTLAQIGILASKSNQRMMLLKNLAASCTDLNFLMQILLYYSQRYTEEEEVFKIITDSISRIASKITLYHSDSDSEEELKSFDPSMITQQVVFEGIDNYGYPPSGEQDSTLSEETGLTIDESEFLYLCIELLLMGRDDLVQRILTAFHGPADIIEAISEIIHLSPRSFEGMLLACDEIDYKKGSLQLEEWPHSVLLTEAEKVTDYESFTHLIDVAQKLVDDVDIPKCYRSIIDHLQPKGLQTVLEAILNDNSQKLDGFNRAILLSNIVRVLANNNYQSGATYSLSELAIHACDLLEEHKLQTERYWRIRPWGHRRNMFFESGINVSPLAIYSLGMAILSNDFADAGLMDETQNTKNKALAMLYTELRKVERWSDIDFERAVYMITYELGNEDLTARVAQTFNRWNWN